MKRCRSEIPSTRRVGAVGVRPTIGGVVFLAATVLVGLTAIDTEANLLLLVFGLCVGALFINAVYGWRMLRSLAVRRLAPAVGVAGQPLVIRYEITSLRRWGHVRAVHLQDPTARASGMPRPEAFIEVLRPGETVTRVVTIVPPRRGRVALSSLRFSMRFPFHIFEKHVVHVIEHEVIVFPPIGRLLTDIIPTACRSSAASTGGSRLGHLRGDEEYYGVREYREGDNPRQIHWRRSARTGQLMIREMSKSRSQHLWCVVNTLATRGDDSRRERLETAISAAATVLCDALERGIRVGLICSGRPLVVLPPGSGRAYRPRLLSELAVLADNATDELAPHLSRMNWPARWWGPCLLFASAEDEDTRESQRTLSRSIGAVTLYVPGTRAFDAMFDSMSGRRRADAALSVSLRGAMVESVEMN